MDAPFYAYVDLYVGGFEMTPLPPQYLLNFTHTRNLADTANNFEFSVFDETALELEFIIATNPKDVLFQYGYTGGEKSPLFSGMVLDYKLEFRSGGVVLNVSGTSNIVEDHAKRHAKEFKNKTIDEIVAEVAKLEGWSIGYIEPCVPLLGFYDNKDIAKEVLKPFRQSNISSLQFIKSELMPYAISAKTGESDFKLYFKDESGGSKLYFTPLRWKDNPIGNYLFDYNKSGRSRIISFSPEVQGSVILQGGDTVEVQGMDTDTNEMVTFEHTDTTNPDQPISDSKSFVRYSTGKTPINISAGTIQELQSRASDLWYKIANMTYPASMSVIGDPSLEPNTNIEVLVMTNQGIPHHSSGVYLILGVTDDISGGSYNTDLNLIKNAVAIGGDNKGGEDING